MQFGIWDPTDQGVACGPCQQASKSKALRDGNLTFTLHQKVDCACTTLMLESHAHVSVNCKGLLFRVPDLTSEMLILTIMSQLHCASRYVPALILSW